MTSKYVQRGDVVQVTPNADVANNEVVLLGTRIGVAITAIASGKQGSVQVEGVFELKKKTTDAPAQGASLYWDNTNKELTTTSAGNTLAGWAWKAAANGDTTVQIKLLC